MAPSNPLANSKKQKAFKLLNQGRVQEAIPILEQLVNKYPKDIEALATLGSIYGQAGQLEPAVHYLERVIEINPNDLDTLNNLGVANMMLGNTDKARDCIERSLRLNPNDAGLHFNLATILQEQSEFKTAIEHFRQALQLEPSSVDVMVNLGVALKDSGQQDEAIELFKKAINLDSKSAEANLNLGHVLARSGKPDEAVRYYEQAAASAPSDYEKIRALANIRVLEGAPAEGIKLYEQALSRNSNDARIYREYGQLLQNLGQHESAMQAANKALELQENDIPTLLLKAKLHREVSQHPAAMKYLKQAYDLDSNDIKTLLALAGQHSMNGENSMAMSLVETAKKLAPTNITVTSIEIELLTKTGQHDKAIRLLEPLLDRPEKAHVIGTRFATLCKHMQRCDEATEYLTEVLKDFSESIPVSVRRDLLFELGKLYDGLKQADKAFDLFQQANALKNTDFNCTTHHDYVDALKLVFSHEYLDKGTRSSIDSNRPVFIVGMPRSGTSLTEQIIASHPDVYGAGELGSIAQSYHTITKLIEHRATSGETLELTQADCDKFSQIYLDEIKEYSETALHVTDKMPTNFLYLGLIQQLFPETRIIHTLRSPLDVCLSIYSLDFAGRHAYAYDLKNLGCFYNEYRRIMKHWHEVLELPVMDIQYEDLVNDQETWSRKLIDFCGLEWDDACLDFHKSKRVVNTASNQQVTQPIYKGAMQRWRPYEKHLQPLIDALEPEYRKEAGVENWDY